MIVARKQGFIIKTWNGEKRVCFVTSGSMHRRIIIVYKFCILLVTFAFISRYVKYELSVAIFSLYVFSIGIICVTIIEIVLPAEHACNVFVISGIFHIVISLKVTNVGNIGNVCAKLCRKELVCKVVNQGLAICSEVCIVCKVCAVCYVAYCS